MATDFLNDGKVRELILASYASKAWTELKSSNSRKAALTDETLEKLRLALCLNEVESEYFYDLAAIARNTVSADLPEYIMENEIVRAALRTAKKNNATDQQWEEFITNITKQEE